MQKWMDSVPGQTFLNYAYSWGASVVILGTLFKLTHLPGANIALFLGMGTEVLVFFISAFDRPFDKSTIDMNLATHYEEDSPEGTPADAPADAPAATGMPQGVVVVGGMQGAPYAGGGSVVAASGEMPAQGGGVAAGNVAAGPIVVGQPAGFVEAQADNAQELSDAQGSYIEQLKSLTETLESVAQQSKKLALGSEEMENLNRAITGISTMYEMQLKSVSRQVGTIDSINEQTVHMAEQITELNKIYARMIEAMTSNMRMGGQQNS